MADLLAGHDQPPSIAQQIAAVEREIAMREYVFPRRVADKKMTQAKADHELTVMRAVLATLKKLLTVAA